MVSSQDQTITLGYIFGSSGLHPTRRRAMSDVRRLHAVDRTVGTSLVWSGDSTAGESWSRFARRGRCSVPHSTKYFGKRRFTSQRRGAAWKDIVAERMAGASERQRTTAYDRGPITTATGPWSLPQEVGREAPLRGHRDRVQSTSDPHVASGSRKRCGVVPGPL